jgi:hypothetical protein
MYIYAECSFGFTRKVNLIRHIRYYHNKYSRRVREIIQAPVFSVMDAVPPLVPVSIEPPSNPFWDDSWNDALIAFMDDFENRHVMDEVAPLVPVPVEPPVKSYMG